MDILKGQWIKWIKSKVRYFMYKKSISKGEPLTKEGFFLEFVFEDRIIELVLAK